MVSCLPHAYLYEAVILSAANSLSWFIRNFHDQSLGNSTPEGEMEQEIALIPAGANGLLTMPYFSGCMMPYDDPMSRGVTLGWSNVHTKAHLYRSLLEGVAFELKLIIENYEKEFNNRVSLVKVGGGGAQSDLWLQIIADVTGIETIVTSTTENSALGAAIITACSAGLYDNYFTAVEKMCSITKRFYPNETQQLLYDQLFHDVYQHIYPDLQKYLRILGSN
jgi:xylulokinase